jgi:hypothetical protein
VKAKPSKKPGPYRVAYDDANRERVGKKSGPGLRLPSFETLPAARAKCRELNEKLNELYGKPRAGARFPIFFVQSAILFMMGCEDSDEDHP